MKIRARETWILGGAFLLVAAALLPGCERGQAPAVPPSSPIAPPPPPLPTPAPAPVVVDAAADAGDAGPDAGAAGSRGGRRGGKKAAREAVGGGGGSGALKVTGSLPKPEVEKVVRAATARMRACYEQGKAANPALAGKVAFRLTIDDRGRVTLGEVVTSTLGGGDAEMCMVRVTRDLKFPASEGESTVELKAAFGR